MAKKNGNGNGQKATELARASTTDFAILKVDRDEFRELIRENAGATGFGEFDFDWVKIPSGGSLAFAVQTHEGEDVAKFLDGVIVGFQDRRVYWKDEIGGAGGGTPPDCSSRDMERGVGDPGGECAYCPHNVFGTSKNGRGKACQENRLLFFMKPNELLPSIVKLPVTSAQRCRQYFRSLLQRGLGSSRVVTRIGLEKASNDDGIAYSVATFKAVAQLSPEDAQTFRAIGQEYRPSFEQVSINSPDPVSTGDTGE